MGPKSGKLVRGHWRMLLSCAGIAVAALSLGGLGTAATAAAAQAAHPGHDSGFNRPGDILIADAFNNRVVEINRDHQVVWHFGNGSDVPGPHSIVGTNDVERVGSLTLIAGTGTPPGADPSCAIKAGCPDNRVILVNQAGHIVWMYGKAGVTGFGPDQLNTPVQNTFLPGGDILITDQGNERVIEVNRDHEIVWQYGQTGTIGAGPDQLNNPNSAELLANGHILISDENNNRAIEVNRAKHVLRAFTAQGTTSGVAFASRLPNGDTLITDSNNSRIVEVNTNDHMVWQYLTNTQKGSNTSPLPTRAVRLRNGDTLISDQFNDRVIEINHSGKIVFQQGRINISGAGHGLLNAPYDAKVVGDYTGLTPPFGFDD
jgi:hypothetical protein